MMTVIDQIVELSGPLPDTAAHVRWLETRSTGQLEARLKYLREENTDDRRGLTFNRRDAETQRMES